MLNLEDGIDSLANFKRQTADSLRQLHATASAMVLTVNGKAEVVVQDAAAYQRLVEQAAKADREEAVAAKGWPMRRRAGRNPPARHSRRWRRRTAFQLRTNDMQSGRGD